ncbi:MAG TPA: 3-oxoacyl-[acyl-carrier-protein] synthase III C-terminal domain-containing protein [Gemmataceae bacterium]
MSPEAALTAHLLARLRRTVEFLGQAKTRIEAESRFAEVVDSMGFVEFLALVADNCGVTVEAIEQAAGRRFGSVAQLAAALHAAGLRIGEAASARSAPVVEPPRQAHPGAWLAATAAGLPKQRQSASAINALLHRPAGWLENHAGIQARCLWDGEDALDAAARTANDCLRQAGLSSRMVSALLVTSEAPPVLTGLAAAIHQRLGFSAEVAALEIGGACTGFLAAMWAARRLLADGGAVLVLAVEAPSLWLRIEPGPAGEAASLFGDAAAACVLTAQPSTATALPLRDIQLGTNGAVGSLLRVELEAGRGVALHMDGPPLAQRAVRTMADSIRQMSARHGLNVEQLAAVVAHGGNGRMPALLARRLSLPVERVWSETANTGNLGSASLPVAWANRTSPIHCPMIWTAVGAGLQWGAALFDGSG